MKVLMKELWLPKMVKILSANANRLSGALHVQFQNQVYVLVKRENGKKIGVPQRLMTEWAEFIELETDAVKQSLKTVELDEMHRIDKERDRVVSNILELIKAQRKSPIEEVAQAAMLLYHSIGNYRGIQSETFDAETGYICSLLKDLEPMTAQLSVLQLSSTVGKLKQLNEAYEKLFLKRQEKLVQLRLPTMKDIRLYTDQIFNAVCRLIEAAYVHSSVEDDQKMIEKLVDHLNAEIKHFKTTQRAINAQQRSARERRAIELRKEWAVALRVYEEKMGLPEGSLHITGKIRNRGKVRTYELLDRRNNRRLYVKMTEDGFVEV